MPRKFLSRIVAIFALSFLVQPLSAEPPLKVITDAGYVTIAAGDSPIMRYHYAGVPFKPYVDQFFTPSGINILRDSPFDHKHHHGLMFAVAADGVNFWEEQKAPGRQQHVRLDDAAVNAKVGSAGAGFTDVLAWIKDGNRLLEERRHLWIHTGQELPVSLLTWACTIRPAKGHPTITLTGSPYFGLGMRFVTSMDKNGAFLNADDKTGVAGTHDTRSRWCAYQAMAEGKPVTVAVFDHPRNPRHPAAWFTMDQPFAYLAVTLNLSKEPLRIEANTPLQLKYGVALWDGHISAQEIGKMYDLWAKLPQPQKVTSRSTN